MNRRTFLKGVGFSATATALSTLDMPAVWAGGKSIRWRMVTSWPKNMFILQTGAERFAGDVKLMSRGKLDIQVLAGGELVGPLEVFGAVSKGTAECGNGASYYWAEKMPAAQWFTTVPFGLKAKDLNID